MRRSVVLSLFFLVAISSLAQKKDKEKNALPLAIVNAQSVYVTSWRGDLFDTGITMDDRQAITGVQNAINSWHHYRVVSRPEDADITIVVKPAITTMPRGGIPTGGGTIGIPSGRDSRAPGQVSIGNGPFGGAEVGTGDDSLMVALGGVRDATEAGYLWRRTARNGLRGSKPSLVEAFKKDVEASRKP